jgi:hypothetical protein
LFPVSPSNVLVFSGFSHYGNPACLTQSVFYRHTFLDLLCLFIHGQNDSARITNDNRPWEYFHPPVMLHFVFSPFALKPFLSIEA